MQDDMASAVVTEDGVKRAHAGLQALRDKSYLLREAVTDTLAEVYSDGMISGLLLAGLTEEQVAQAIDQYLVGKEKE